MDDNKSGISILGQEIQWPNSWPAMWSAVTGCVAVILIVGMALFWLRDQKRLDTVSGLVGWGLYSSSGKRASGDDVVEIYRFWTPNMYTKRDVKSDGKPIPKWDIASDCKPGELETENQAFLTRLNNFHPAGIDIYSIVGVGTTPLKRGYVWDLSVSKKFPINRSQLLATYKDQWGRDSGIWLEEYSVTAPQDE